MTDKFDGIEVGNFDPVAAFSGTIHDYAQVVDMFDRDTGISPEALLEASKAAAERLKVISTITMDALMAVVISKIPPEVVAQFRAQMDLDELMQTPEEQRARVVQHMRDITKNYAPHNHHHHH